MLPQLIRQLLLHWETVSVAADRDLEKRKYHIPIARRDAAAFIPPHRKT